jgi:DNA-binding response OmpR family regulator
MNKRILLVDDNTQIRASLSKLLVCAGYDVSDASNGRDALRKLASEPVDLVVTDLVMPEMEGIETIFSIRRQKPKLPIIAMSGGGVGDAKTYLAVALKAGVGRAFAKPFENSEFLSAIKELLDAAVSSVSQITT